MLFFNLIKDYKYKILLTSLIFIITSIISFAYIAISNPVYNETEVFLFPTQTNNTVNDFYTNIKYGYIKTNNAHSIEDKDIKNLNNIDNIPHYSILDLSANSSINIFNKDSSVSTINLPSLENEYEYNRSK